MKQILIVDDEHDLVFVMKEMLLELGAEDCVVAASLADVLAQENRALACSVAIVDINLGAGQPTGLDVHGWLRTRGFQGRIVFLTGHAHIHPLVVAATRTPGTEVVAKPIDAELLTRIAEVQS